jgi:hypothetical protein
MGIGFFKNLSKLPIARESAKILIGEATILVINTVTV